MNERTRATPARMTLFTGSALGDSAVYADGVRHLAEALAAAGIGVVYGGGRVGLMGVLADSAIEAGAEVIGVIPQHLVDGEIAHRGLTSLEVVPDMHARKLRMAELGDAFVALPGGVGTLEELFEVWTWQQLGIHAKPVALYDIGGYWTPLLDALDTMTTSGFIGDRLRGTLIVADDPEMLMTSLATWTPPTAKWAR